MRVRLLSVALLTSVALAAAGCGGGNKPGTKASGASLIRSNVLAFLSVNSDLQSSQWHQVANLVRKFPSGNQFLSQLQTTSSSQGVTYKRDIAPALGPEVDLVVSNVSRASLTSSGPPSFVLMTKPRSEGKLKSLLSKAGATGTKPVYKKVNGWYLVSTKQSYIDDATKKSGKSLEDQGSFQRALKALPKNALVKAYVSGSSLRSLIQSVASSSSTTLGSGAGALGKLDFVGLALSAENDGVRLVITAKGGAASTASSSSTFSPKLVSQLPGDTLAVLSFRGSKNVTNQLNKALQNNPSIGPNLQQLQTALGVTPQQVFSLLEHEVALYVRPGAAATSGVPEISALLEEPNEAQSLSTLDTLFTKISALSGGTVTSGPGGIKTAHIRGRGISYGGFDSRVVISSSEKALTDLRAGSKLSNDPTYMDAKSAAGVPDKTSGFLYVNLKDTVPLIETYEQSHGHAISPTVRDNLAPLKSLFAFASSSGGVGKFTIFLEIK